MSKVETSNKEMAKVIEDLRIELDNAKQINLDLLTKLENRSKGDGRKAQVLALLRENGAMSIKDIAEALAISLKNVSSQLCYLKDDGYSIWTVDDGKKFLNEIK